MVNVKLNYDTARANFVVLSGMTMIQIVYASRPFGFDAATLSNILNKARSKNARDDVTGALICRADLYLQLLEGPKDEVEAAYARIEDDDRHLEVKRLIQRPIETRMFPGWAMRDDPVRSWMWSAEQVADGAVAKATEAEVLNVFSRLAADASVEGNGSPPSA